MAGIARLMAVSARRGISRRTPRLQGVVTVRGKHHVPKRLDLVGAAPIAIGSAEEIFSFEAAY